MKDPTVFNPLQNDDYLWYFNQRINSKDVKDLETACSCLYFFFQKKESLIDYFVHNIQVLQNWLCCARSTDSDLKKAFMNSLKELLKIKAEDDKDRYNEIIRRLFSNITTPYKMPDMG